MAKPPKYPIKLILRGEAAYLVDELLRSGWYGVSRDDVVDRILADWVKMNSEYLNSRGIDLKQAEARGYIPRLEDLT